MHCQSILTHCGSNERWGVSNVLQALIFYEVRDTIREVLVMGSNVVLQNETAERASGLIFVRENRVQFMTKQVSFLHTLYDVKPHMDAGSKDLAGYLTDYNWPKVSEPLIVLVLELAILNTVWNQTSYNGLLDSTSTHFLSDPSLPVNAIRFPLNTLHFPRTVMADLINGIK